MIIKRFVRKNGTSIKNIENLTHEFVLVLLITSVGTNKVYPPQLVKKKKDMKNLMKLIQIYWRHV